MVSNGGLAASASDSQRATDGTLSLSWVGRARKTASFQQPA